MTMEIRESALLSSGIDNTAERVLAKAKWRIIPFLFLCFVVNYIDRSNVGFAKLHFQSELGFSDTVYGLGVSLFFVGYLLFEVPSNLILARIGARRTLSRIMILWGLASIATMFVATPGQFYLTRFLVGAFEAGFVPGVVYYLSQWFPNSQRARITSLFMLALPISGVISNPLSGWIMSAFEGLHGWAGWQWLFLVEGIPSVLLGVVAYISLSDKPDTANWLTNSEKRVLNTSLEEDHRVNNKADHNFMTALRDPRLYGFAFVVFSQFCVANVFAFWGPTILKSAGLQSIAQLGLLNSIPFVISAILMILVGRHSDKKLERPKHAAFGQVLTLIGLLVLPYSGGSPMLALACLAALASGHYTFWSIFWTIPPTYLSRAAAPGGIAVISSLGATGGFFASNYLGWVKTSTGSLNLGFYTIAVLVVLGMVTLLTITPKTKQANAKN